MPWTLAQRQRLATEKAILNQYFSGRVSWIDPTGETKVDVTMITNTNQRYTLRVYLGSDFPNSLPDMVVHRSPKPMPNWGSDGSTHTLGRNNEGFLRICHYRSSCWGSDHTLYEIFMKGLIWLEGYEGYVQTGKSMETFLGHMIP